jgi:hypothetical protein
MRNWEITCYMDCQAIGFCRRTNFGSDNLMTLSLWHKVIAGRGDREGRKCLIEFLQFFWCMYFLGFPAWEIRSSSHIHFIFILIVPSFSHQSTGHRTREYLMFYRGPGFLAVVWFGSFPIPFPFPVSKLSLFHSLPLCRLSSLLT